MTAQSFYRSSVPGTCYGNPLAGGTEEMAGSGYLYDYGTESDVFQPVGSGANQRSTYTSRVHGAGPLNSEETLSYDRNHSALSRLPSGTVPKTRNSQPAGLRRTPNRVSCVMFIVLIWLVLIALALVVAGGCTPLSTLNVIYSGVNTYTPNPAYSYGIHSRVTASFEEVPYLKTGGKPAEATRVSNCKGETSVVSVADFEQPNVKKESTAVCPTTSDFLAAKNTTLMFALIIVILAMCFIAFVFGLCSLACSSPRVNRCCPPISVIGCCFAVVVAFALTLALTILAADDRDITASESISQWIVNIAGYGSESRTLLIPLTDSTLKHGPALPLFISSTAVTFVATIVGIVAWISYQ